MVLTRRALFVSSLVLGACGGSSKPAAQEPAPTTATDQQTLSNTQPAAATPAEPATPSSRVMAKMQEFTVAMCDCKDADCAKRVSDEMTKWSQQEAQTQKEPVKMSEEDMKQATELGTRMGECMQRAMGAGNP